MLFYFVMWFCHCWIWTACLVYGYY